MAVMYKPKSAAVLLCSFFKYGPDEKWRDCSTEFSQPAGITDLLLGAVPQCSVDGVGGDVCPVDVAVFGVPVQRHGIAHVSQRNDIIGHVLCVEADSSDVRPSGKKQELVKTWLKTKGLLSVF